MSTLLRDIFTIPETTSTSDYVLRLTESVEPDHLSRTLSDYVVTEQIVRAFDQALAAVADGIARNTSMGRFLTGSFGSGKSHFMAVLYALLRQDPRARAIPELAGVIARHDPKLQGRRVLPLTFHMLGAASMEEALFDGYLRQIRELHPDAPLPALLESTRLLADADELRTRMGDDAFFAGLNDGAAADPWAGVLGGGGAWDAASFASAKAAAPDDPHRAELVTVLHERYFTSYTRQATHVGLDEGLAAISSHAQSLGYDAVVLFLDELVLWLAFQIRNHEFFGTEIQKITKLVEGGRGGRRIPLISFIARQMDLRRWLADSGASGAQQRTLEESFSFQEGRFPEIRLGDDNLPHVAAKRLLTPQDAQARAEIDRAFDHLDRRSQDWDVLLDGVNTDDHHRGADAAQFRLTYPFSPALVSTLRSLAGVMQRERTALKVMQQLLVDGRESLTIDDVIPVGDAFDHLVTGAAGDQPLDEASAALFRSANTLYREKLRPLILKRNNVTEDDLADGAPTAAALAGDLRLAKTLLLSAVAPNVPALKSLTASRLAALNHGSIRSPLPGGEVAVVLAKVRDWATEVPEIRVERSGNNPLISVQLSDVDYESVIDRARGEDNDGRRRELIKRLVLESLGLGQPGLQEELGAKAHQIIWRGSRREVDLVFGNVRDAGWLTDDHFRARPGTWRFVIDHPFDDPGHSASEDLARVDGFRARNWDERTIVWLPRFFNEDRMRDVSRLAILNYLFEGTGDRYANYSDHLSETGRLQARAILQAQREALLGQLNRAILVAYDVDAAPGAAQHVVDASDHPEVLTSLTRSFTPRPPAGGQLKQAFEALTAAAFTATYPGHPDFLPGDREVRPRDLAVVYDYVERALADKERRIELGPDAATVRWIANPLGVGKAAETVFLMGDDYFGRYGNEFEKALSARGHGQGPLTAGEVRGWIARLEPAMGLADDVADLVVLAWAALRRRAWYLAGAAIEPPQPGRVRPEMELREQEMPDDQTWRRAAELAGHIFGVSAGNYVTPAAVANLAEAVRTGAREKSASAHRLAQRLGEVQRDLDIAPGDAGRLATARAAADLCEALRGLQGLPLIKRLAASEVPDGVVVGRSLSSASDVTATLDGYDWSRLDALAEGAGGEGPRAARAADILTTLRAAVVADEFVTPLARAVQRADAQLFRWLQEGSGDVASPSSPAPAAGSEAATPRRSAASGRRRIAAGEGTRAVAAELERFAAKHPDEDIVVEWRTQ